MAARYAVAAGGNWNTDATWSTTSGGTADTVKPTASDDVFLDASSGNVTINATSPVCRSLNCTGYTGTLTHSSGVILSIGDATAGAGDIALKFVSGMTYTIINNASSELNFVSTAATTQEVDFAGKTTGNVTFNATAGGVWQYTGTHNTGAISTNVTLTKGTLDINGQTCSWGQFSSNNTNVRTLTLGAAHITIKNAFAPIWSINATNLTWNQGTSLITFNGALITLGGSGLQYYDIEMTGAQEVAVAGSTLSCRNFSRIGTATTIEVLRIDTGIVCTGTLTLTGNSSKNRLLVRSNSLGSPRTITNAGATMAWSNVDFRDIALSNNYDASGITGGSGDCGGNSNIIFTTPTTQTWSGTSGGNYSANAWTTHVPLPQDTAAISAAFSGSQTVTLDMARIGTIDFTGASGSPTFTLGTAPEAYGGMKLVSGITFGGANTVTFMGRGSYTLTSGTKQYPGNVTIQSIGGTYTLGDAFSTAGTLNLTSGTFNAATYNVTFSVFFSSNNNGRVLTMGSGVWSSTATSATTIFTVSGANITVNGGTAAITITGTSSNLRTFSGGGKTYGSLIYILSGSTGGLDITGSNTFDTISFSDASNARTIRFTSGTLTRVTNFTVNGTAGNLMTVNSTTAGNRHTLSCGADTVDCVYLDIKDSNAEGGAGWFAGVNSVNSGNNLGWQFTAVVPPSAWHTFGDEGMSA